MLGRNFAVPVLADACILLRPDRTSTSARRHFPGRIDGDDGTANAGCEAIALRRDAEVNPIALANVPVECWTDQRAIGGVGADHDLEAVALGAQHASDPCAPGRDFGFETSGTEDRQHGAQHRIGDDAGIGDQTHLDLALFVLHAVVEFLCVDHAFAAVDVLRGIRPDLRGSPDVESAERCGRRPCRRRR